MTHQFRLKPSTIEGAGVGVFATRPIPKGTLLKELFAADDQRVWTDAEFAALDLADELLHYCIPVPGGYSGPADFNRPSVGWFLNHADEPNLAHEDWEYHALRDIAAGEELLIDYDRL